MPWRPMDLRGSKVLARCEADGKLRAESGRVEIRYKPSDGRAYRATAGNLVPIGSEIFPDDHCADGQAVPTKTEKKKAAAKAAPSASIEGAVVVYADGACSGNPGPAGLGVVIVDGKERRELSEFLGTGTNNIAELTAIQRAAEALAGVEKPVRIFTDSKYSIGVLTQGWKAKKNIELIANVKRALAGVPELTIHYVPGHAGVALNEAADQLAVAAVEQRKTSGWIRR
jgi:ribonuclease HI